MVPSGRGNGEATMATGRSTARLDADFDPDGHEDAPILDIQAETEAILLEARESLKALEEGRVVDGQEALAFLRRRYLELFGNR